jgi:hypothetical protein
VEDDRKPVVVLVLSEEFVPFRRMAFRWRNGVIRKFVVHKTWETKKKGETAKRRELRSQDGQK